jgi:hypothetical protein
MLQRDHRWTLIDTDFEGKNTLDWGSLFVLVDVHKLDSTCEIMGQSAEVSMVVFSLT